MLTNLQRHNIGIKYKENSFEAKKIGAQLISTNISKIISKLKFKKNDQILIYCWRGGLRSLSLYLVLKQIGYDVYLLDGGYKSYRKFVVNFLEKEAPKYKYNQIMGITGVGKTFFLKELSKLNQVIDYKRDFYIDFFGFKTLERAYLLKINNQDEFIIVERPQDMWLRVAACIHNNDLENTIKTYDILSNLTCTHATPTLFNSGNIKCQLSSCFLLGIQDSLDSIADCWKNVSMISSLMGTIFISLGMCFLKKRTFLHFL